MLCMDVVFRDVFQVRIEIVKKCIDYDILEAIKESKTMI
jgi:hypothetical protein